MISGHKLFLAKVMHKRFKPKVNAFNYKVYYLALKLSELETIKNLNRLKLNKIGILSFFEKDHGEAASLKQWVSQMLAQANIENADGEVILVTLPRVLNYVFNPISCFFCFDKNNGLKAVICEVHNTFGETHNYVCTSGNNGLIDKDVIINTEKFFHVSPFMQTEGHYEFRFDFTDAKLGIWIDHYDINGDKNLITSLIGSFVELNDTQLRLAFWKYPLITFKTIFLIHWQALKLVFKGVKYVSKPIQNKLRTTNSKITNL